MSPENYTKEFCSFNVGEDEGTAQFSPVSKRDEQIRSYYLMPKHGTLYLASPSKPVRIAGKNVKFEIKMEPSATFYHLDGNQRKLLPTNNFPPRPGNYIFDDGTTFPDNMRELIAERVLDHHWNLELRLAQLLFPNQ